MENAATPTRMKTPATAAVFRKNVELVFEEALLGLKVGLGNICVTVVRLPLLSVEREVEVMTGSVTVTVCRLSVVIEGTVVLSLARKLMKIYDISRKEMITRNFAGTKIRSKSSTGLEELRWKWKGVRWELRWELRWKLELELRLELE